MSDTGKSLKLVPSPNNPSSSSTIPKRVSLSWPIVMREGIACGLIIISGLLPSSPKGISRSGKTMPIVPFCPCLLLNLSPIVGLRLVLILTFANV